VELNRDLIPLVLLVQALRPDLARVRERRRGGRGRAVHAGHRQDQLPKRDLATTLQVLFQTERLKIAEGLPLAEVLMRELLAFRVKINLQTGHDSYGAWRERDHDDLVLAVALACYWKHNRGRPQWLDPLPAAEATL
jgi:hypothetical protein